MSQGVGAGVGTTAVERGSLEGETIREPLIALDLQRALGGSWRRSCRRGLRQGGGFPSSEDHRLVARVLKQGNVRFLFYATHSPEDVTTVRGAPIFLKPGRPEDIVQALVMLTGAC